MTHPVTYSYAPLMNQQTRGTIPTVIDGVSTTIAMVEMTHELARLILEANERNRVKRNTEVDKLLRQMDNGRWSFTGDPIKIAQDGRLLDGQHRLTAFSRSTLGPTMFMVVTGLPDEVMSKLDTGLKRTAADTFSVHDITGAHAVPPAIRFGSRLQYGEFGRKTSIDTHDEVLDEFHRYRDLAGEYLIEKASLLRSKQGAPRVTGGFAWYLLINDVDPEYVTKFLTNFKEGVGLTANDPILRLRNRLANNPLRSDLQGNMNFLGLLITTWNDWITDTPRTRIQLPKGGQYNGSNMPEVVLPD